MHLKFLDDEATLVESCGELAIKRTQYLPQEFLDDLADARSNTKNTPAGEYHRVCSIPVAIVNDLKRQGFDIFRESPQAIIARLKLLGFDKFITTDKRIG